MRVLLLYNPVSGRAPGPGGRALVAEAFGKAGWHVLSAPTPGPEGAADTVAGFRDRIDGVVCLGGDGTVNQILPALVHTPLFLGILPGGTANLTAMAAGLRGKDLVAGAQRLVRGEVRPVTVGTANGRHFLAMVGLGFDAAVVAATSPRLKRRIGKAAFVVSGLSTVFRYPFFELAFAVGADTVFGTFGIVANHSRYADGWLMAPEATLEDPALDLCVFKGRGVWRFVRYLTLAPRGRHVGRKDVVYRKVERVRVTGPDAVSHEVDGEAAGPLPVEVQADPAALNFLFPAGKKEE